MLRDRLAIHAPGHPLLAGKGVGAGAAAAAASCQAAALERHGAAAARGAVGRDIGAPLDAQPAATLRLSRRPRALGDGAGGGGARRAGAWRRKFQRVGSAQDGLAAMGELSRPPRQG